MLSVMEPSFPKFFFFPLAFAASEIPTTFDGIGAGGCQLLQLKAWVTKPHFFVLWRVLSTDEDFQSLCRWGAEQSSPSVSWSGWQHTDHVFQCCSHSNTASSSGVYQIFLTHSTEQMFPFLVWSDASDVQTEIRKGEPRRVSCLSEAPICQFLTGRTKGKKNQTPNQKALSSCFSLSGWCCNQNPHASVLAKD